MPIYQYTCDGRHRFESFKHRIEDRHDATCECGLKGTLIMSSVMCRMARPFTVYDHEGTILHQRQTIEKTPPPGYRYENPNLAEV